ncbi:MAG: RluA family pseudouridine synthase [Acidobacteriota bacterium]
MISDEELSEEPEESELIDAGEPEPLVFSVDPLSAGMRLDAYLAVMITTTSRTQIRRAIEAGKAQVDGVVVTRAAWPVSPGEKISISPLPRAPLEARPSAIPLDIIYEDEALIVINKPAGMVTHPGAGVVEGTLANALVYRFNEQALTLPRRGGASRPGIVHRLDAGTSGVIVAAKTDESHLALAEQFQSRRVRKIYTALVYGQIANEEGRIDAPIGRDPRSRIRMAIRPVGDGREALSLYRVRRRFREFTLLEVEIKTGRTHQIRVHLAHLRHPIAGDSVYDGGRINSVRDIQARVALVKLNRPFLHATTLGLFHPLTGQWMEFTAELPTDLRTVLEKIAG